MILINAPVDVDQTSPLVGEVGAVPGIIRRLDTVVVEPKIFKFVLAEVAIPTPAKVRVGLVSVLLVKVCVAATPTKVSVASGSEIVRSTVCVLDNIVRVFVVPPAALNMMRLVASTESCTLTEPDAPLPAKCKPTLASPPVAEMWTALPVAAFSIVTSFTADAIEASFKVSLPFASLICAMTGVVIVGEPDSTTLVVPVDVVTPLPPLRTGSAVPL